MTQPNRNWQDFFANDPDWLLLKKERTLKTEKKLSKIQYLRLVGADAFTEKAYINYIKHFNETELRSTK